MKSKALEKLSIYGPDLAIAGLVAVIGLFLALASELVVWWESTIGLAAVFGTRAAALFHDVLKPKLYSRLAGVASKALKATLSSKPIRDVLLLLALAAVSIAALWLIWRTAQLLADADYSAFRTALAWSAFGAAILIAVSGLAGQYLWFRWRRAVWIKENPEP